MSSALRAALRLLQRPSAASSARLLTDRAAGPGGLFRVRSVVNPSAAAAAAGRTRLRAARSALEERARLADDDPAFETECELRDFVEMRIQESMRTGQFDNLKNKGRPLPGPHPASALDVALRIMRQNGVRPHWLQLMHDIDHEKRLVRAQLQFAWHTFMPDRPNRWDLAVRVAELKIVQVNSAVDTFNLIRPMCVGHLFRLRLRMPEELKRAQESPVPDVLARKRRKDAGELEEEEEKGTGERGCADDASKGPFESAAVGKSDGDSARGGGAQAKQKENKDGVYNGPAEEPRPSWQSFARFVRATEVREYELPAWGRRRPASTDSDAESDAQKNDRSRDNS